MSRLPEGDWCPDPERPGWLRDPGRPGYLLSKDGRRWRAEADTPPDFPAERGEDVALRVQVILASGEPEAVTQATELVRAAALDPAERDILLGLLQEAS
jgi:hypothetical protein